MVVLVPSHKRNIAMAMRDNSHNILTHPLMNQPINFIIWNVRGANNPNFRRNLRELMDTHKPSLIALLETRMATHISILEEFNFTEMIKVSAEGQAGGMVILWNHIGL